MVKKIKVTILALLSAVIVNAQCEQDLTSPWFIDFQSEITVECDELDDVFVRAGDDCDTLVDIAWYDEVLPGDCPNTSTITRLYRAFDNNGNNTVEMQTIYVVDETAPIIVLPKGYPVSCTDPIIFDQPSVTDNCNDVTLTSTDFSEETDSCVTYHSRLWTATDACGNTSTAAQTIAAYDTDPPTITGQPYITICPGCIQQTVDASFVNVTDCNGFTVSYADVEVSGGNFIRVYRVIDYCGNESTFEQILHVVAIDPFVAELQSVNEWLPYWNLQKMPDGSVRKIVRVSR